MLHEPIAHRNGLFGVTVMVMTSSHQLEEGGEDGGGGYVHSREVV